MFEPYLSSIKEHVAECVEDLDVLQSVIKQRDLTRIERKAVERLLQVLVEACIGVAKQWLKYHKKVVPSDAYETMQKLLDYGVLTAKDLEQWRKIIGLRNAIVHDYLNLDARILETVLVQGMYHELQVFVAMIGKRS